MRTLSKTEIVLRYQNICILFGKATMNPKIDLVKLLNRMQNLFGIITHKIE